LRRMDFVLPSNLGQRLLFFEKVLHDARFERGCLLFSHHACVYLISASSCVFISRAIIVAF
jgi:hypothetical protein